MKLSFVIPAYNEENYIQHCIEAILRDVRAGKYDVEIIVVNNASTDRTAEVVSRYAEAKLVYEPVKGLTAARKAGYLASSGELIANVDADTKLPAGWIGKVLQEFSQNDDLVALSGPYVYYDLSKWHQLGVNIFYRIGYFTHLINHKFLKKGAMLQGGNFVLKRSAIEKMGGYNTEFVFYGEDTDIARRIQKVGEVKFTYGLPMYTSARRLKGEGMLVIGTRYAINYFWTLIFKKPFHKKFKDIRN